MIVMFHTNSYRTSNNCFFFFFNDTATTEIYTLSLHDALPIYRDDRVTVTAFAVPHGDWKQAFGYRFKTPDRTDRKSTRLNSSHLVISYAVFCLKKKTNRRLISSRYRRLACDHAERANSTMDCL